MNLLVLLPLGGSLAGLKKQGQLDRFVNSYLKKYSQSFDQVFVASFADEEISETAFELLPNKGSHNRFLYAFLFPFVHWKILKNCQTIRVMQVSSLPIALYCKLFFGSKVAVTYGYDYERFARNEKKWFQVMLFFLVRKILLFKADRVFFPVKSVFEENKKNKKSVWLPNGVDLKSFIPSKTPHPGFKILFVGRLERSKSIDILFDAIANLDQSKKISLTLVGDGSMRQKLEKDGAIKKINLTFLGNVPHPALPKIYQQADMFVLPSSLEGVSKVLLEAMASALPVAVRNIKENRDLIENGVNGFLFDDQEQLQTIIENLISHPKTVQVIGQAARKTVEKNYDLKKILDHEIQNLKKMEV